MYIPKEVRKAVVPQLDLRKAAEFLRKHGVLIVGTGAETVNARGYRTHARYGVARKLEREQTGEAITLEQHGTYRSFSAAVHAALRLPVLP